ncbi:MAG: AraC family transcriptional regulator, partial [Pseudomonadota bacterium]
MPTGRSPAPPKPVTGQAPARAAPCSVSTASPGPEAAPRLFVFLLSPAFSMLAFAAAIEPLRLANRTARRELYTWRTVSEDGAAVTCSNGVSVGVDGALDQLPRSASIVVCGGVRLEAAASRPVITWLRREARRGVRLGAVCTGTYVLAKAGLLQDRRCTIHWENLAAFTEDFPEVQVENLLYVIEDRVFTCAGGSAATDMVLRLIAAEHGQDLASAVADATGRPSRLSDQTPQHVAKDRAD